MSGGRCSLVSSRIEQFFNPDGTLIHIPARQSKKLEVLTFIAGSFRTGIRYSEKEVNEIIGKFHTDTAAIRRHMIEFGIMNRDSSSIYWLNSKE